MRGPGETDASLLKFSAVSDDNLGFGCTTLGAVLLYRLDHVDALHNFAEHHMLPVQPGEEKETFILFITMCLELSF